MTTFNSQKVEKNSRLKFFQASLLGSLGKYGIKKVTNAKKISLAACLKHKKRCYITAQHGPGRRKIQLRVIAI